MRRNLYTHDEIVLCTYIARFGKNDFDENDIHKLKNRSVASIKMKIQNIASMLNEEGFPTDSTIPKLTGKPAGEKGRRTNWEVVSKLTTTEKEKFLQQCFEILSEDSNDNYFSNSFK